MTLAPPAALTFQSRFASELPELAVAWRAAEVADPELLVLNEELAAELGVDADGRATGYLATSPLVGESRAAWLRHYASLHGVDLAKSFAYADSHSDLPMLSSVGNPVAVSPDISLMRAAQRSQWSIVEWKTRSPSPRWHLPA